MRRCTGEICEQAGRYEFLCYVEENGAIPPPKLSERLIVMHHGDHFPSIRSTGKDCWWRYIGP